MIFTKQLKHVVTCNKETFCELLIGDQTTIEAQLTKKERRRKNGSKWFWRRTTPAHMAKTFSKSSSSTRRRVTLRQDLFTVTLLKLSVALRRKDNTLVEITPDCIYRFVSPRQ